jgi:hypothetical protein
MREPGEVFRRIKEAARPAGVGHMVVGAAVGVRRVVVAVAATALMQG